MTPSDSEASDSTPDGDWIPVSVTFGSVTIETLQPPEHVLRANIKAGQDALRRAKSAIILERSRLGDTAVVAFGSSSAL